MSHFINKILGKTIGLNLMRTKPRKVDKVKGKPIYVEFVGIPGVGKSTLFDNVFKQVKSKWRNIHEFQKIFIQHVDGKAAESVSCYQDLAIHKMQSVASSNFSGIDQMKIVRFFLSVIIEDSLVSLFNKDYNVISDEGLIHNFGDGLLELCKNNKKEFDNLMKDRAVVYCKAPAEIVANRILGRTKETGKLLPQHKVKSFDKLVMLQKRSLKNKHQIIDLLYKYDIPVVSIDTSESINKNADKVIDFLNTLSNNNVR